MKIRAVVFDLDGTLIDSVSTVAGIINVMRTERSMEQLRVEDYRRLVSLGATALIERSLGGDRLDVLHSLEEFRSRYRAYPTPVGTLYPGVRETIVALSEGGLLLAVCSNKPENLCRKILDETGLSGFFDAVVGGDTARLPKPARDPLDDALQKIGADALSAILVGDSIIDQRTAAACAVPFVFFAGGYDDGVDRLSAWKQINAIGDVLIIVSAPGANRIETLKRC